MEPFPMFESIFAELDERFGRNVHHQLPQEEWKDAVAEFLPYVTVLETHIPYVDAALKKKLLQRSIVDYYCNDTGPTVCNCRIRPHDEYYLSRGRKLPQPADPTGPSATGIEINLAIYHGATWDKGTRPPSVTLSLRIWGAEERDAFKEMFLDYRRVICLMLQTLPELTFFTSRVFDCLDAYRGKDISRKLDLYFKEQDEEATFDLELEYTEGINSGDLFHALCVLAALYLACIERLIKRGNKDLLLELLEKIVPR
jgi:hypothetical protein